MNIPLRRGFRFPLISDETPPLRDGARLTPVLFRYGASTFTPVRLEVKDVETTSY
jgi:hypothetical protein